MNSPGHSLLQSVQDSAQIRENHHRLGSSPCPNSMTGKRLVSNKTKQKPHKNNRTKNWNTKHTRKIDKKQQIKIQDTIHRDKTKPNKHTRIQETKLKPNDEIKLMEKKPENNHNKQPNK